MYLLIRTSKFFSFVLANYLLIFFSNDIDVEQFQKDNGAKFLWYTDKITPDDFYKYNFFNPDLKHLEWGNLLDDCNFIDFIKQN